MARNFLDEDTKLGAKGVTYIDGFRFGLGQFVAWLVGLLLVGGLTATIMAILRTR